MCNIAPFVCCRSPLRCPSRTWRAWNSCLIPVSAWWRGAPTLCSGSTNSSPRATLLALVDPGLSAERCDAWCGHFFDCEFVNCENLWWYFISFWQCHAIPLTISCEVLGVLYAVFTLERVRMPWNIDTALWIFELWKLVVIFCLLLTIPCRPIDSLFWSSVRCFHPQDCQNALKHCDTSLTVNLSTVKTCGDISSLSDNTMPSHQQSLLEFLEFCMLFSPSGLSERLETLWHFFDCEFVNCENLWWYFISFWQCHAIPLTVSCEVLGSSIRRLFSPSGLSACLETLC